MAVKRVYLVSDEICIYSQRQLIQTTKPKNTRCPLTTFKVLVQPINIYIFHGKEKLPLWP